MTRRLLPCIPRTLTVLAVIGGMLLAPHSSEAQFQGQSVKEGSLSLVPADAAFYSSSRRLGAMFEKFVDSNAFARLKNLESIKTMTEEFENQWNDPNSDFAQAREVLERESTRETLAFLGDMVSNEWWSVGDMKHGDLVELGGHLGAEMRRAQNEMQMKQANGEEVNPMDIANGFIRSLDQNRHLIVIPNSITGFQVKNKKRAAEQLAALDNLLTNAVQGNQTLAPAYSKKTINDTEFLVLDLKGNMVPWQLIGFFVQGIDFQAFNRVVGTLNGLEITLAIGLQGDHVLFLFGESTAYLETLAKGDLLYDREELAPLRKHAAKPVSAISYVSEAYKQRVGSQNDAFAALQQVHDSLQPALELMELNDDIKAMIAKDLEEAAAWLKEQEMPEPGATLSFEYETDRGYEGFAYDWTENTVLDGSQPLPLINHVGGNPVAFAVGRTKYDPEGFDHLVVVLEKVYGYVDTYLQGELDDNERTEYQKVMKIVGPHLKRLETTTREKLIPAMKDGQGGIVLDMQAKSRQWFTEMPPARQPVAIPELAFVYGVDDAKLLASAFDDYHDIFQSLLDDLHDYSPEEIPEIKLPTANKEETESGTVYTYDVPRQGGLDEQVAPSAGLSKSVVVWSYVPGQTKRMLPSKELAAEGGPLADLDRNLAGAGRFDFAGFVDGIEPWVEYGITQYYASQAVGTEPATDDVFFQDPPMEKVLGEVRAVAEVLKCFRGYSSVTTLEDGASVTHFDYHFEDLDD